MVVYRRDSAIRGWMNWVLEDPLLHAFQWLRLDLVPPARFLHCDPYITSAKSGVLVELYKIDEQFS